jgi:hypothetical protein
MCTLRSEPTNVRQRKPGTGTPLHSITRARYSGFDGQILSSSGNPTPLITKNSSGKCLELYENNVLIAVWVLYCCILLGRPPKDI